jgi:hypothetical protein
MTQAFGLKQVVSQLPFARYSSACVLLLIVYLMPRKTLEEVKAYEIEQLRLRTERRIAQLRRESYELELSESEVFSVCALLYIALIILFYARLYLR